MESSEQAICLIYDAIEEINQTAPLEQALEKSPDTVLVGESGRLDSLGFVNLIAILEENIQSSYGKQISLIDIMTWDSGRPWTVGALANCIAGVLEGVASKQPRIRVPTV